MNQLNKVLRKYELKPKCYRKNGNVTIVDSRKGTYVVKEKKENRHKLGTFSTGVEENAKSLSGAF